MNRVLFFAVQDTLGVELDLSTLTTRVETVLLLRCLRLIWAVVIGLDQTRFFNDVKQELMI